VDERSVFGAGLVRDAQRFERFLDWTWVLAVLVALAAYGVMVRRGRVLAARLGIGPVNAGIVVAVVVLTVVWATTLPFRFAALWWERRHGVSFEAYGAQVFAAWAQLLGRTLIAVVALAIVLGLAHRLQRFWWLPAALALGAILLVLSVLTPYLVSIGTKSAPGWLHATARTLERREHAGNPPIRIEKVSARTNEENAFSIGIGPTERVVVWDTLLDQSSRNETRFVLAHELAHLARNHVLRAVGWFTLLALPVLLVVALVADLRRPETVPLALLLIAVARLALLPFENAVSRRYESEADWIGLNGARTPAAASGLFVGFVSTSLQDPSPPGWVHALLDNHPTPLRRVEMARAWAERNR
jgi:STE24 endopeptidase